MPAALYSDRSILSARLPRYGKALIHALRFNESNVRFLKELDSDEWQHLLNLCDRMQITLLMGCLARAQLPASISSRIGKNYRDNATRFDRLQTALTQIGSSLDDRLIDFTILKGFTHASSFVGDPLLRSQGDIDLWCQGTSVFEAQSALIDLGYRSIGRSKGRHLDPMVREQSWQWRGDYYDPELPIPVDLHYKLWDEEMEHIAGPAEAEMWDRRSAFTLPNGRVAYQLGLQDSLAFAALHFMMHLLHGDMRLQRAWEIAYFLQSRHDDRFWRKWKDVYSDDVRQLQVVTFAMVHEWFGGMLPNRIEEERERLPADLNLWIEHYVWSPVESLFKTNKDELWLNLALLRSKKVKSQVFVRRLLPLHAINLGPVNLEAAALNRDVIAARFGLQWKRTLHHTWVIPHTCFGAIRWWWRRQELGSQFVLFALASGIFDFGEFVFFLLYNVYLVQCGFHEKVIGQIAAAVTFGTFAGAIPAAAFLRSFGMRTSLLAAIAGAAMAGVIRIFVMSPSILILSAFLNGAAMSFWAVSLPPVVAGVTNSKNRTLAFSIVTAIGIGVGSIAGIVGGSLPGLLAKISPSSTTLETSPTALLAGCAFLTIALVPMSRLRINPPPAAQTEDRVYPRSRFTIAFFVTLFIWSLGTGGFNPFFNLYFSRHLQVGLKPLGLIFSFSQFAQVISILILPALLKAVGEVKSVAAFS